DVRVDAAGKDVQPGRIDLLTVLSEIRPDLGDPAVPDPDVSRFDTVRGDHRPPADDHLRARRARKRPRTSIATDTSAAVTDSAGLWLTPPLQRTKSMQAPVSADIATRPGWVVAAASTASTSSAAAVSASLRRSIGTVPAWPAWPVSSISIRLWPAIAETTPTGRARASSTGPCSMCTSQ